MKVSIITYHSAYNFGSALQAYATQHTLENFGYDVEIINYRMNEQAEFYQKLYKTKYGIKSFIKDITLFPLHKSRLLRAERFEKLFEEYFRLTPQISEPSQVLEQLTSFDVAISGSDQIWNKHSCELEHNDWRYMDSYLLKGFNGRKISYASSIGNMTDSELKLIIPELQKFNALSFREATSAEKMAELLARPVETVLDPTFLLRKKDWIETLKLQKNRGERYILAYFLCGPKQLVSILPVMSKIAKKRDCHVKVVTPFAYLPYPDKRIEYHPEFGPIEFLNALYTAEMVVTDSYHGTILSVNFGKDFYSICKAGGAEFRKTDILNQLGLQNRAITDLSDISANDFLSIDYRNVYRRLDVLREHSFDYLKKALE